MHLTLMQLQISIITWLYPWLYQWSEVNIPVQILIVSIFKWKL